MTLKKFKPVTGGTRHRRIVDKSLLWKGSPFKPLTHGLSKSGGRNFTGKITVRHIGGGNKRTYRLIDFIRTNKDIAIIKRLEYDPNRSAFIALIQYLKTGLINYILAPQDLKVNDLINKNPLDLGSTNQLKTLPLGTLIHNIELVPNKGGILARSAGTYGQLMNINNNKASILLSSGITKLVDANCSATIGKVSNPDHSNIIIGKAGITRLLGIRPTVRGEAMNPVDHPHGGRTRGGRLPVTPWGKLAHGKKTARKIH